MAARTHPPVSRPKRKTPDIRAGRRRAGRTPGRRSGPAFRTDTQACLREMRMLLDRMGNGARRALTRNDRDALDAIAGLAGGIPPAALASGHDFRFAAARRIAALARAQDGWDAETAARFRFHLDVLGCALRRNGKRRHPALNGLVAQRLKALAPACGALP